MAKTVMREISVMDIPGMAQPCRMEGVRRAFRALEADRGASLDRAVSILQGRGCW